MVVFYSLSGHTRAYAVELASLSKDKAFELREKKKRPGILGFMSGAFQSITKKEAEIMETPDLRGAKAVYVCSPVWASGIPPAIRYFLNHAPLKGVTVNFLLTCMSIEKHEDYRKSALDALNGTEAIKGAAYVFACPRKEALDAGIVTSHIKKVILGVD